MEYINLKAQYNLLKSEIDSNIQHVIDNTSFIMGDYVGEFERELAEYVGVNNAIGCSDGTTALQLAYMAYGVGVGDAVFCPCMTFIASIEPAVMLGATAVFCEIDDKTYNIDVNSLERQINAVINEGKLNPKAIVAVDFLGNPADYCELRKVADKYNLILIEDAAQGIGAYTPNGRCGSFGDIATTSFFPSKPLGCYGDGGAVFTNDDYIAGLIKSLRVHGKGKTKYDNVRVGVNSRLDTIQAAVLLPKLHVLSNEIDKRQQVADRYNKNLSKKIDVPYIRDGNTSSYAQYVIRFDNEQTRTNVISALEKKGIPSLIYYPNPMHLLPVFKGIETYDEVYENTIRYSKQSLGIPFSPYITEEEQDEVIGTINMVVER